MWLVVKLVIINGKLGGGAKGNSNHLSDINTNSTVTCHKVYCNCNEFQQHLSW